MVRLTALYRYEPDEAFRARYALHAELCRRVPGATFSHGPVFGPRGSGFTWMGAFDFPDRDAFDRAMRSEEMRQVGSDAREFAPEVEMVFSTLDGEG